MRISIYYLVLLIFFLRGVYMKNITVGLTYTNVNMTNLAIILNNNLLLSKCPPNNYTITFIPYVSPALFQTPINTNNAFQNTYMIFGTSRYFTPSFFGFSGTSTDFLFKSAYVGGYSLDIPIRYLLILTVLNNAVQNDTVKGAVFILNANTVDQERPYKLFNPHQYLALFNGAATVFYYNSTSDAVRIAEAIKSMGAYNIVMDLNFNSALEVLNACNNRNLLNWRQRWMVFFSLLPNQNTLSQINLPLSNNFTMYDFGRLKEFTTFSVNSETDVYLYDVCYTMVKLMDYHNCNQQMPSVLNLGTGIANFSGNQIMKPLWVINAYRNNGTLQIIGNVTIGSDGTVAFNLQPTPNVYNRTTDAILAEMKSKPFRIAAMLEPPFVYNDTTGALTGHSIETIKTILNTLQVNYNITPYNVSTGTLRNGQFSGILGVLQSGFADIAIGPITYFEAYKNFINMTISYKPYNLAIAYNSTQMSTYEIMFQFIFAFAYPVWILIVASCVVYAAALTVINLISPNEAKMTLFDTFFFTMGSMVQGVTTALPDKVSGRILVIFWWVLNICILLAYVSNYGANLTSNRLQATISSETDLTLQTKYSYGTVINSSIDEFLFSSTDPNIQAINTMIRTVYIQKMSNSTNASIALVNAGLFAFIYQDPVLQTFMSQRCMTVAPGTPTFAYVYALTDSDYTTIINSQLANLINTKAMETLNTKYFTTPSSPPCTDSTWLGNIFAVLTTEFIPSRTNSLNIQQTSGIFIIMIIGIIIALFVAVVECIVQTCRKKRRSKTESEA